MTTWLAQFVARRGTAAEWTTANTVLMAGEMGFETDTGKHKIGDGTTAWSGLPYFLDETQLNGTYAAKAYTSAKTLFVSPDGANGNDGRSPGAALATLDAAFAALPNGGRVCIEGPLALPDAGVVIPNQPYRLMGITRGATVLTHNGTGDALSSAYPINSSNEADLSLEDLQIASSNAANVGAAFDQVGGTRVYLRRCRLVGFKYGVIFDQTEFAAIDDCEFDHQYANGAALWLVNGADHTAGAAVQYTNHIDIRRCLSIQSTGIGVVHFVDDGGDSHRFEMCKLFGGDNYARLAGGQSISISGGEWEACTGVGILTSTVTRAGTNIGGSKITGVGVDSVYVGTSTAHFLDATGIYDLATGPRLVGNSSVTLLTALGGVQLWRDFGLVNLGAGGDADSVPATNNYMRIINNGPIQIGNLSGQGNYAFGGQSAAALASMPADATDLASAIALVNAIKATGQVHGLWL